MPTTEAEDALAYPGFTTDQIDYLTHVFPSPLVSPHSTHQDLLFAGGSHQVVLHIKACESFLRSTE